MSKNNIYFYYLNITIISFEKNEFSYNFNHTMNSNLELV